jgi:hypothetical protein
MSPALRRNAALVGSGSGGVVDGRPGNSSGRSGLAGGSGGGGRSGPGVGGVLGTGSGGCGVFSGMGLRLLCTARRGFKKSITAVVQRPVETPQQLSRPAVPTISWQDPFSCRFPSAAHGPVTGWTQTAIVELCHLRAVRTVELRRTDRGRCAWRRARTGKAI